MIGTVLSHGLTIAALTDEEFLLVGVNTEWTES